MRKPDVVTVAVSRVDGGVTVLRVIETEYDRDGEVTRRVDVTPEYVDGLIAKYVAADRPEIERQWVGGQMPVSWRFVPNDYVDENTDRYFRNAWKDTPGRGKPDVDMPKAREVHRQKLRRLRIPLMDVLDVEYQKADERGDQQGKRDIAGKKQALRDVTADPRIDAAQTPEELKAVLPEALRGE
jgi:hypothetical protein